MKRMASGAIDQEAKGQRKKKLPSKEPCQNSVGFCGEEVALRRIATSLRLPSLCVRNLPTGGSRDIPVLGESCPRPAEADPSGR